MDPSSLLSKSGVLYWTNFEEWKERVVLILQVHGLESHLLEGGDGSNNENDGKKRSGGSDLATGIIVALVNPAIIDRIPVFERSRPWLLMQRLQDMTTQFRFLDLPAELRNRIFSLVLTDCDRVTITPKSKHTTGFPAITKISRQVRSEVLPVFYSSTTFELLFHTLYPDVPKAAQNWARIVGSDWLKQVRNLSVSIQIREGRVAPHRTKQQEIRFTLKPEESLQVHYPEKLTKESKALLDRHVNNIESTSEVMGIHRDGRTLLLALVHQHEKLWHHGTLYWKK